MTNQALTFHSENGLVAAGIQVELVALITSGCRPWLDQKLNGVTIVAEDKVCESSEKIPKLIKTVYNIYGNNACNKIHSVADSVIPT